MSPKSRARLVGVFYALEGFPAAFGQAVVLSMVVVNGDAAATARNVLAHESLYRLGFAIPVLAVGFHIAYALLFFQLFRVVNRTVNLVAVSAILVGCAVQALAALVYLAPLVILQSDPAQQSLAFAFVNLSHQAFDLYLIFFGLWCVLAGYLILNSSFLPRILGALLILDGIGWMLFLWPPLATSVYPAIEVMSALAEIPLLLWLLVFGVNDGRWVDQAGRSASGGLENDDRPRARQHAPLNAGI